MLYKVAYEPDLIPPPELMSQELQPVLEDWIRWGEEWSFILRAFSGLRIDSACLEIGCGLGRIAFPLRYVLMNGTYDGFDIVYPKIDFLNRNFTPLYPNFNFRWVSVRNTHYNPNGAFEANNFVFPYPDNAYDVVFAASVFTHMVPENTIQYFAEAARVLKPGGFFVVSLFLLENYDPKRQRLLGFARPAFDFPYQYKKYDKTQFAINSKGNPELMTSYSSEFLAGISDRTGLVVKDTLPGFWSNRYSNWIGSQDIVILTKDD